MQILHQVKNNLNTKDVINGISTDPRISNGYNNLWLDMAATASLKRQNNSWQILAMSHKI